MTIPEIALLPKRCFNCNRVFIWERYKVKVEYHGIEGHYISVYICQRCIDKEEQNAVHDLHSTQ